MNSEQSHQEDGYCRMTDHTNLYNKALTIIKRKGFDIFLWPNEIESISFGTFYAKKGNRNFDAEDPLRLLGMITIWEIQGDEWNRNPPFKSEKIRAQLMKESYPDSPDGYDYMTEEEFARFVKKCQDFFTLGMFPDIEIKDNISRVELIAVIHGLSSYGE